MSLADYFLAEILLIIVVVGAILIARMWKQSK